mgnify:CR=1 FL=1
MPTDMCWWDGNPAHAWLLEIAAFIRNHGNGNRTVGSFVVPCDALRGVLKPSANAICLELER